MTIAELKNGAWVVDESAIHDLPQGTLLLAEPMMGTPGAEPVGDAYFGFYLLAMGRGRPRTPRDLKQMLESAGFARTQLLKTRQPLQSRVLVAHKRIARKSVKNN